MNEKSKNTQWESLRKNMSGSCSTAVLTGDDIHSFMPWLEIKDWTTVTDEADSDPLSQQLTDCFTVLYKWIQTSVYIQHTFIGLDKMYCHTLTNRRSLNFTYCLLSVSENKSRALWASVKIKLFPCVVTLLLSEHILGFLWSTLGERHKRQMHIFTAQVYNRFYL